MPKKVIKKTEKKVEKVKVSLEEFEAKVKELAEQGLTAEKIGETLRKAGIHSKEFGKKMSKVMGSKYQSPDILNIKKKLDNLVKHVEKNRQDKRAMREKDRIFSHLRKQKSYFNLH